MQQDKTFLGTEPIGQLLRRLAIPTVIAQLVNMLYNIVDRIYIGHIPEVGSAALTGVGVCLPIILIVSAFACFTASGGAPRASIYMGRDDMDSAEKTLGGCFTMQIGISVVLTAALLLWGRDALLAFGASENTIGYAADYLHIYAFGTLFVELTLGMNAFITAQGFAKVGMYTVLIGAAANIILDPVFIFVLGMGVQGIVMLVQVAFSRLGTDLASPTSDSIAESSVTVSMWLYVGLVAPICEEVLFRGVLMKELKPLGKNFAIVTSAMVFGLFHDDVVQGTFAFLFGLILGFVAMEYSLVWSIALHIFNNAILSGAIDTLAGNYLDDNAYLIFSLSLSVIGVIGSIIIFVIYGKEMRQYHRTNRSIPDTYFGWAAPTFIIFVVANAAFAIISFVGAMMG